MVQATASPRRWYLSTPLTAEVVSTLRAGDLVSLSGVIYTARDAAHARMKAALARGEELPVDWRGQVVYYAGPCPTPPGKVIGSIGPTTSGRMDSYAPALLARGLAGMIGKGQRGPAVVEAMRRYGAVYFAAWGGAGALIARTVQRCEPVAYPDLGPEAIYRLEVVEFPLIVAIDRTGRDLYQEAQKWRRERSADKNAN